MIELCPLDAENGALLFEGKAELLKQRLQKRFERRLERGFRVGDLKGLNMNSLITYEKHVKNDGTCINVCDL